MKFKALQQDLLPAISAVARSVGIRSTLPILDNLLLSAQNKKLKIAGTNLEIGVIKFLTVDVLEEGETTVPAKTLVDLVSNIGQTTIEIESQNNITSLQSGKLKAQINGIAPEEFPVIPTSKENGVSFSKEVIQSTSGILFAAAVDEGRPVLTGILTEVKDNALDMVATDGFRLAHRHLKLPTAVKQFKSLIPKRTYEEVVRIISEEEVDQVSIAASDDQNQIIFNLGQTLVSSRLIEGNFPSWEKIIPKETTSRMLIDKGDFLKALKLAAIFARNEANVLVLNVREKSLVLESSTRELGSQENEIDAQVEGDEVKIAFNSKFLHDAISNAPATQLMVEFSGPLSPALIKPVGVEGLEYIVMPVRLS
ncbi:MAG: DNA polymerase III subunit beta [Candidatus Daviesbacteria bacterium]|nr:DNA polymerase III subunit beta [Candidatus Daviesbacteria bacterium]